MSPLHMAIKALLLEPCLQATRNSRAKKEAANGARVTFDPLTIIKPPHWAIVLSGKNRTCLNHYGLVGDYYFSTRIVDDPEVELFLDNLNIAQARYILNDNTVFAPVMTALWADMANEPELVEENQ